MLTLAVALLSILVIALLSFIIWERYRDAHKPLPSPSPLTLENAYKVLDDSIKKSREIISQAEVEGSKLVTDTKFYTQKANQTYESRLKQAIDSAQKSQLGVVSQSEQHFTKAEQVFEQYLQTVEQNTRQQLDGLYQKTAAAQAQYEDFIKKLSIATQQAQLQSVETAKQKVDKLFEDFEVKLADFLLQSEQKMMLAVDLELRSARQLIDTYKVQQMNVIDENIVAMLEKTLSLVLAKNLNLKDQMDFVYESLEKAKAEKFIV